MTKEIRYYVEHDRLLPKAERTSNQSQVPIFSNDDSNKDPWTDDAIEVQSMSDDELHISRTYQSK